MNEKDERPSARPNPAHPAAKRAAAEEKARIDAMKAAELRASRKWYHSCWTWGCALPVVLGIAIGIIAGISGNHSAPDVVTEPGPEISSSCMKAMYAAEQEATDEDTALLATLGACGSRQEWIDALKIHPTAGTLTSYTDAEAGEFLDRICEVGAGPACDK